MDTGSKSFLEGSYIAGGDKHNMKFSVIIPVFNRQEPIKHAIRSVLNQDFKDWECLVVDDASTDDTLTVIQDFSLDDSRIKVIGLEKNSGVSAARNAGLEKAEGEWILFLDSDDELNPNAMSILSNVITANCVDMVVFATSQDWIPAEEISNKVLEREFIRSMIFPQHINIHPQTDSFLQPYICNKCVKRSLIMENGIRFDEWRRTWEDNVFLVKCLDCCKSLYVIPDKLYLIGDYPGTNHLSRQIDKNLFLNYIDSYYWYREHFGSEFDFDNDYTARRYFGVIHEQLVIYFSRCNKKEFLNLLSDLLHDNAMNNWIDRIQIQSEDERNIKKAFKDQDEHALYQIYATVSSKKGFINPRIDTASRIFRGLKRRIKRLKKYNN